MQTFKKFVVIFTILGGTLLALTHLILKLDLAANPAIRAAAPNWRWHDYATSTHALSAMYANGNWLWLAPPLLGGLLLSALVFRIAR